MMRINEAYTCASPDAHSHCDVVQFHRVFRFFFSLPLSFSFSSSNRTRDEPHCCFSAYQRYSKRNKQDFHLNSIFILDASIIQHRMNKNHPSTKNTYQLTYTIIRYCVPFRHSSISSLFLEHKKKKKEKKTHTYTRSFP